MVHFLHCVISSLKYLALNVYISFRLVKSLVFRQQQFSSELSQVVRLALST